MELKETVKMMVSEDYKERFKAEYHQLNIRIIGLSVMLEKYKTGKLNFRPKCSYDLLNGQLKAMKLYRSYLEERGNIEDIWRPFKEECPCMKEPSINCGIKCSRCGREL